MADMAEDPAALKDLGNAHYKKGKYQDAVDAYTQAIEADPTEHTFFGNRAAALMMLKKYDDALSDCKAATSLDPSFTKGYMRGAKCYSQRGMMWEAKDMLQKVLARDAANAEATKEMASIEQLEKDIAEAKAKLAASDYDRASYYVDRILPLCPDATSVMAMRAELLIGRKKFDDAASITWALLAKDRNNPDLLHLRGKALLYGGSSDQAMKHFQEALRVDPDHARARTGLKGLKNMEKAKNLGNEAFKEGRCEEAIEAYTEALGYDALNTIYNSTVYCNRAAAKMKIKQYKEALEDCEESIKLNEGYIKAYTRKAECLIQTQEYDSAIHVLEATLKMDPDSRDIKQRLRDAKLELKKSKRKDYYKILGVTQDASESDIKKAYKKAALRSHPDKCQDTSDEGREAAEKAFKDVGEAYSVLSDTQKKARYDAGQDLEEIEGGGGFGGGEMDPNALFQMFMNQGGFGGMGGMGGMGGRGGMGGHEFHFG